MKRFFDIFFSLLGLISASPVLLVFILAVFLEDRKSPFYVAPRVGLDLRPFRMIKLRSMRIGDGKGPSSTSSDDARITKVGRLVRKYKLDELTQLCNVLIGDMSMVGPRPNVQSEVELYTEQEKQLLSIRPGITDISSIVFADEGEILKGSVNPDLDYNQLIRPWKSRLGLFYIANRSLVLDFTLIGLTLMSIFARERTLEITAKMVARYGGEEPLVEICRRSSALTPTPPPGSSHIVTAIYLSQCTRAMGVVPS